MGQPISDGAGTVPGTTLPLQNREEATLLQHKLPGIQVPVLVQVILSRSTVRLVVQG